MGTEPSAPDKQPSVPDEVWEQLVQDDEKSVRSAAAPKEPSARQRMVTERLRRQDAAAAAGRKGRKAAEPEGWRTGPAWREMDGRATRGRKVRGLVGVLVAAGLAVVALDPSLVLSRLPDGIGGSFADSDSDSGSDGSVSEPVVTLAPETAAPTAAPSPEAFFGVPTLEEPFIGSPAGRYADGADGIVLPEARAVGRMTRDQVDFGLRKVKEFLVDANLDPATLRGERPETALALVEPIQSDLVEKLETAFKKPDKEHDPALLFSRFDPAEVKLVGDVVKTRGRTTFTEGEYGSVKIRADYTFVYPLVKAEEGSTEVARTIVRRILEVEAYDPKYVEATAGKLSVIYYNVDVGNDACSVYDGYLHPEFPSDLRTGSPATGPAVDPYDRSRDIDSQGDEEGCGTVSRT